MRIDHPHSLGRDAAIARIQGFVSQALSQPLPGGVTVKDVTQQWTDGTLDFSFRALKGFFGGTVKGRADVTDEAVALDSELPGIVSKFVSEDTIRRAIGERLAGVLR